MPVRAYGKGGRDVELGYFGGPGQKESPANDSKPHERGRQHGIEVRPRPPEDERGHAQGQASTEPQRGAPLCRPGGLRQASFLVVRPQEPPTLLARPHGISINEKRPARAGLSAKSVRGKGSGNFHDTVAGYPPRRLHLNLLPHSPAYQCLAQRRNV